VTPGTPGFPAVWLRHNCPCPDCRDPVTGQRLLKITDIPNGLAATVTAQHDTEIVVTFAPDGHRSVFRRDWLAARALETEAGDGPDPRTEDGKVLWRAADLPAPHTADWAAYTSDDRVREGCLDAVARYGCALLRGVPVSPGMVLGVAATFGDVRETSYGRLFDVRVEPDPDNLAFTSREIAPHTDNPYRDPESFGVLTGTPVPFGYIDKETELTARQPLISLSPRGRIAGIRYNDRSMLPLRLPGAEAEAAYAAIGVWARLLARPEFPLRLRLSPGDCLIFDNTRVLHARTAFAAPVFPGTGERHRQGCYADLDGLLSTLAVLRRRQ